MANASELTKMMNNLEEDAVRLINNPDLTLIERRRALEHLLSRYRVLEHYKRALAAYVRRMQQLEEMSAEDPEAVIRDILSAPEFVGLQLAVFVALLTVIYGEGPRAAWVPPNLLLMPSVPGLLL